MVPLVLTHSHMGVSQNGGPENGRFHFRPPPARLLGYSNSPQRPAHICKQPADNIPAACSASGIRWSLLFELRSPWLGLVRRMPSVASMHQTVPMMHTSFSAALMPFMNCHVNASLGGSISGQSSGHCQARQLVRVVVLTDFAKTSGEPAFFEGPHLSGFIPMNQVPLNWWFQLVVWGLETPVLVEGSWCFPFPNLQTTDSAPIQLEGS